MEIQLEQVLHQFEQAGISEMEVETSEIRIHLKKEMPRASAPSKKHIVMEQISQESAPIHEMAAVPTPVQSELTWIKAPLVGTYYEASAPGEAPYVTVGQHIAEGDVVALVEAMKLMNEIQSEVSGIVREVKVSNEALVEYNQPLIGIEVD